MKVRCRSGTTLLMVLCVVGLCCAGIFGAGGCATNMTPEQQAATLTAITMTINAGIDSWIRLEERRAELEAADEPTPEELQVQLTIEAQRLQMYVELLRALGSFDLANTYEKQLQALQQEAGPKYPELDVQSMLKQLPGAVYDAPSRRWDVSNIPMVRLDAAVYTTACGYVQRE